MILKLFLSFVIFIFIDNCVTVSSECTDCIQYQRCAAALNLIENQTLFADATQTFRNAYCGSSVGTEHEVKVCCSQLENNSVPLATLTLLPENCGEINEERSIGGKYPALDEYPWIAAIFDGAPPHKFLCTGSIINSKHVLTAATCVKHTKELTVRLGEYNLSTDLDCVGEEPFTECKSNFQDIAVDNTIIHENFHLPPRLRNNIALLHLREAIDFNYTNAASICLPKTEELRSKNIIKQNAIVIGWAENDPRMLRSHVQIKDGFNCENDLEKENVNRESLNLKTLCVENIHNSTYDFYSGNPLVLRMTYNNVNRYIQYGLMSHRTGLCSSNMYTYVSRYIKWILKNLT